VTNPSPPQTDRDKTIIFLSVTTILALIAAVIMFTLFSYSTGNIHRDVLTNRGNGDSNRQLTCDIYLKLFPNTNPVTCDKLPPTPMSPLRPAPTPSAVQSTHG
jgi:hypothetical protein